METLFIILFICGFGMYFFIRNNNSNSKASGITKINDKNWIINNKLVSFEKNTPMLNHMQKMEDDKHYRNYEFNRLRRDREKIYKDYSRVINAIYDNPNSKLLDCVTEEKLEAITEEYDQYVHMCKKLEIILFLTKEQFLIKKENPMLFMNFRWDSPRGGIYEIHNEETAKYLNGNYSELMEEEFKKNWY